MIFLKLTKVVGDIESLLGCFSSNTLWRWYAKLDFFPWRIRSADSKSGEAGSRNSTGSLIGIHG